MKAVFIVLAGLAIVGCQKKSSKSGAGSGNQSVTSINTSTQITEPATPITTTPTTPVMTGLNCSTTSLMTGESKTVILDLASSPKRMQIRFANGTTQDYNMTPASKNFAFPTYERFTVQDSASSAAGSGWVAIDPDTLSAVTKKETGFRRAYFSSIPLSQGDSKSLSGFMDCK